MVYAPPPGHGSSGAAGAGAGGTAEAPVTNPAMASDRHCLIALRTIMELLDSVEGHSIGWV